MDEKAGFYNEDSTYLYILLLNIFKFLLRCSFLFQHLLLYIITYTISALLCIHFLITILYKGLCSSFASSVINLI